MGCYLVFDAPTIPVAMTDTTQHLQKAFGRQVRQLRKLRQFTQEEVAGRAGISYKYVGQIERGEVNPSLDIVVRLAQVLEVAPADLLAFAQPNRPKRVDISCLTADDIKAIKQALAVLRRVFG